MRVCDITREDEVTSAFTIIVHRPGVDIFEMLNVHENTQAGSTEDIGLVTVIETGKRATEAMAVQDWAALNNLTPHALRKKNPAKVAAAKKAQATKAAKAKAAEGSTSPPAAPSDAAAPSAPADTGESDTGVYSGVAADPLA